MAAGGLTATDVSNILQTARAHNAQQGITGCLLLHNHQFIQILEGEKGLILQLLENIKKDKRHSNINILGEDEKPARVFKEWTMAYRELKEDEANDIKDALFINNLLGFAELSAKPTRTVRLFWERVQRLLTNDFTT
jgi:hypothetical protein